MVSRMVSQAFRVVVNHPRGKTTTTFIDMSFPWRILLVPRPGLIYWNYLLIKHIAMEKNSYIQGKSVSICKRMIHICKHHLETDHVHPFYIANCQKHQRLRGFSIDSYEVSRPATHSTSLLRPWKWALNVTTTLSENVGKTPWAIAIRLIIIIPLKWPILEVYPPDTSIYWWIVVISCNILTLSIQNPKQKWYLP